MNQAELLAYCLDKPGAWRDEPWEGDVVANKTITDDEVREAIDDSYRTVVAKLPKRLRP